MLTRYLPSNPLALVFAAFTLAMFVGGTVGCGRKQSPPGKTSPVSVPAPAVATDGWENMDSLETGKWEPIDGAAEIVWDNANRVMRIGMGTELNGVRWAGPLPTTPYAVELDARRISGSDFFCGLTFPVRAGNESVTLIVGGWGGNIVGISSIDNLDASENSTASQREFEDNRWYRIRVEVRDEHLQAWIDDHQVVDTHTEDQKLSLRPGPIEGCAPFGIATWLTIAETRGVKWRKLED